VSYVTRRQFLADCNRLVLAGSASLVAGSVLAACGTSDDLASLPDDVQIVQRFPQNLVVGPLRMPLSLASAGGLLTVNDATKTPAALTASIVRIDGGRDEVIVEGLIAKRHDASIVTPYWPFFVDIREPGFYRIVLEGGPRDGAAFQVFARSEVAVPGIGDVLPALDTPTLSDARGVNPLCTRQPQPCALHDTTLRDALTLGKPIVLLVGTPAHCATGTCAPALDALLSVADRNEGSYTFIHAEVYADPDATKIAPTVEGLSMNYEPALFVTDERGVVTARLDAVFDEVELSALIG
jgi:hypothetical protein